TINQDLINEKDIPFMPCDIEEYNEYINNTPHYVYDFMNTKLFESKVKDILIKGKDDEGETVDMTKLRIEHVKAFPIRNWRYT
ncbi:1982_t:CDS:2, partial [Dentiscutata erythropus]